MRRLRDTILQRTPTAAPRGRRAANGRSSLFFGLTMLAAAEPLACGGQAAPQDDVAGQGAEGPGAATGGISPGSGGDGGLPGAGGSTAGTHTGGTHTGGTNDEGQQHECRCAPELQDIPVVTRPTQAECVSYCVEQEDNAGAGGGPAGSGGGTSQPGDSADALLELQKWLAEPPAGRSELDTQSFATVPLSADDALTAKTLLWEDLAEQIRANRQGEVDAKRIVLDGFTLDYETVLLGQEPADGRSLFISMHGGGSAPKETNDQQWQNQIQLAESYAPKDALWIAPRAPTDDWNMWFKDHIIPIFDQLISNMIVLEGIHPDKVYLTGYSAGGDGVYQLGPTMADRWAGAAMSAGHPNDMTPLNLRNVAFAIHVGGDDTAFDRNLVAGDWGEQLAALQTADPEGYPHQVEVHQGLPHWMNLADQPSVPFIQSYTRSVYPKRVVWRQSTLLQTRFYWLEVAADQAVKDAEIIASIGGQTITVESATTSGVTILLSDEMLDLDQEVSLRFNGTSVFQGAVSRTILTLHRSLSDREDPAATFSAEISVAP